MGKSTGLAKEQARALACLKTVPGIERFYLAGGSAIAWHLHHRRSNDLDLFSLTAKVNIARLRTKILDTVPGATSIQSTEAVLRLQVEAASVDIVRYQYPLLDPPTPGPADFPVATLRDLAAMKIATIIGRGLRRDFWDLHEILNNGMSLKDAVGAYRNRFGLHEHEVYAVARALTYFVDAENDPVLPPGLTEAKWERIKSLFSREAPKLLKE